MYLQSEYWLHIERYSPNDTSHYSLDTALYSLITLYINVAVWEGFLKYQRT